MRSSATSSPANSSPAAASDDQLIRPTDIRHPEGLMTYLAFRLRTVADLLPGIHRAAGASNAVEEVDRAETQDLIGVPVAQWADTDSQLEQFVSQHSAAREAELAQLLHRRIRRQIDLIEPGMRDVRGFRVQPIDWSKIPTT